MADRQQELDYALRAILWAMQKNEEVTQQLTAAAEHIKKAGGVPGHAPQVVDTVGRSMGQQARCSGYGSLSRRRR